MRYTKADLDWRIERINQYLEGKNRDMVRLEYSGAPQRPRLQSLTGHRDLGPRLPTGQMADYLDGILLGIEFAKNPYLAAGVRRERQHV